jgi:aryl-alcohol dehydrogenase-like predicted oxidoreductase
MQFCEANGIAVIPYSPLEGGFLSGKYRRGAPPPKSQRAANARRFMTDEGYRVVETLEEIASSRDTSGSAVALAWLLTRPAVVAPIIGANSPVQLEELLPAAELKLSENEIATLDRVSAPFAQPSRTE